MKTLKKKNKTISRQKLNIKSALHYKFTLQDQSTCMRFSAAQSKCLSICRKYIIAQTLKSW